LLGEGSPRAAPIYASEAQHLQVDDDGQATDGQISQMPRVATVQVSRPMLAVRTASRSTTPLNDEMDQAINQPGTPNGKFLEVW
jgi:hypothetical protein